MEAAALLRPGLLDGLVVALGGGGDAFSAPLGALGARTAALPTTLDEDAMTSAVEPATRVLVHDLRPAFAGAPAPVDDPLRATLDLAWVTVRAVANAAFIPFGARGGKVTLIAPAADRAGDPDVAGVRAAAENLARTLSIEWARHGITTVAITPGAGTAEDEIAALAAYLASPAGDYFSGARLALGEVSLTA